jgi:hypothetical protein
MARYVMIGSKFHDGAGTGTNSGPAVVSPEGFYLVTTQNESVRGAWAIGCLVGLSVGVILFLRYVGLDLFFGLGPPQFLYPKSVLAAAVVAAVVGAVCGGACGAIAWLLIKGLAPLARSLGWGVNPRQRPLEQLPPAVTRHPDWPVQQKTGPAIFLPRDAVQSLRIQWSGYLILRADNKKYRIEIGTLQKKKVRQVLAALAWTVEGKE